MTRDESMTRMRLHLRKLCEKNDIPDWIVDDMPDDEENATLDQLRGVREINGKSMMDRVAVMYLRTVWKCGFANHMRVEA